MSDCLARIPYASLIGFIMVFVGGGIMCGTLYIAVGRTDVFVSKYFFPFEEFFYIKFGGIVAAGSVVLIGIILLIFACLVTNATHGKVYRGDKCLLGGRCSAGFFMFVVYLGNLTWLCLCIILTIPVLFWLIFWKICNEQLTNDGSNFKYTFNISNYGIYPRQYLYNKGIYNYTDSITDAKTFSEFCRESFAAGQLYACSLGGAVFVILGWLFFLSTLSSYHAKLRLIKLLTQVRKTVDSKGDFGLLPASHYDAY